MTTMKRLSEAFDNSHCSVKLDLLSWRLRFDAGFDRNNSCCELVWFYFGPLSINLALGH